MTARVILLLLVSVAFGPMVTAWAADAGPIVAAEMPVETEAELDEEAIGAGVMRIAERPSFPRAGDGRTGELSDPQAPRPRPPRS